LWHNWNRSNSQPRQEKPDFWHWMDVPNKENMVLETTTVFKIKYKCCITNHGDRTRGMNRCGSMTLQSKSITWVFNFYNTARYVADHSIIVNTEDTFRRQLLELPILTHRVLALSHSSIAARANCRRYREMWWHAR